MKKIYFLSGLGADKRIFSFMDLSFCEPVFVNWIQPHHGETLEAYASRLRLEIADEQPTVVGISFGGMLATEMAKADPRVKAIIISSNKTAAEFPSYLRVGKYLPLYKWMPVKWSKKFVITSKWILGAKGKQQRALVHQIIRESDISFSRWAIHAILHWRNTVIPPNLVHIHGTSDRLLPYRKVKADFTITGGTHIMTMDHHAAITEILKKLIL